MNDDATLQYVASADGTTLAYERHGDGPAVILVGGAAVDRRASAGLVAALAPDFAVYNFDRRGRGESGDTLPYAVDREIEDIAAMLGAAGGSAHLCGSSSGAALALLAAARRLPVIRMVLWEPPYKMDAATRPPTDAADTLERLVAEGRRADAVEYFMTKVVGMPPEAVSEARTQPWWADQENVAHTLAYDDRILADYSIPLDAAARVAVPTLILTGGKSFPFLRQTAEALAKAIPDGRTDVLEGQEHVVDPTVLAPAVTAFLKG
jgi:pimeloyl-ACP methyl ester carboxylesterase